MSRKVVISLNALLILGSIMLLSATKEDKKNSFNVKAFEKSLCYIPMGSWIFEDSSNLSNDKVKMKMVSTKGFYMCNHVVTNKEYRMFLEDLKKSDTILYKKMRPDSLVWFHDMHYPSGEAISNMYFWHPAYYNYPVVGVSHEQAQQYCKWLSQKYMKEPNRKFKNVEFRLPNLYEWEWAAKGGLVLSPFPWQGLYVRNAKGQYLANFIHTSETSIKRISDTGKLELVSNHWMDGAGDELNNALDITSPAISYYPNNYGLYNMAGNVEEYVAEVGIAKGGSWRDPGYYIQTWAEKPYKNAQTVSDARGFRVAMYIMN